MQQGREGKEDQWMTEQGSDYDYQAKKHKSEVLGRTKPKHTSGKRCPW